MDSFDKVVEKRCWVTTDGRHFDTADEAGDHQEEIDFDGWCQENICVGGEWSAQMVSRAILGTWVVRPR